jgi:outer membrane protein assembly factor BamB
MRFSRQIRIAFSIFYLCAVIPCRAQSAATNLWALQVSQYGCDSSPAIAGDGTIYQATFEGRLVAITSQGEAKWAFKTGREIKSSPAVADDGTIYFGSRDRNFYAVTPDGRLKWSFPTGAWVDSSPAIGADGTIYFGSWDTNFYALNPDGSKKWIFTTGGIVDSSPAIGADGTIYFGSHDKKFYALTADGRLRWALATGGPVTSSPAIGADGTIYFTSTDGNLYALKPDGSELWRLHTGGFTEASPVLDASGQIYLAVNGLKTSISATGKKIWEYGGSPILIGPAPAVAANGLVYFASSWGSLIAYDAAGHTVWSADLGRGGVPTGSTAISADGVFYTGDGRILQAFAATNGAPLAKISWPMFHADARHTGRVAAH